MNINEKFLNRTLAGSQLPKAKAINKTVIACWVNALKGKYRGRGNREVAIMLDRGENWHNRSYSALGVLCEITEPYGWKWGTNDDYLWHDGYLTQPSPEFLQRHGITELIASLVDTLNEGSGKSLGAIANYLEKRYLGRCNKFHRNRRFGRVANRIHGKIRSIA